jgi:hypothetical protein
MKKKAKQSSSQLVVPFTFLNILLSTVSWIAAIHGTWFHCNRLLRNRQELIWSFGIFSTSGRVSCDSENDMLFFSVCMSIFKNVFGALYQVSNFICSLETLPLKIEEEFLSYARVYKSNCDNLQNIFRFSILSFLLLSLANILFLCGNLFSLKFYFYRFNVKQRYLYWFGCLFQVIGFFIFTSSLLCYVNFVWPNFQLLFVNRNIENLSDYIIIPSEHQRIGNAFFVLLVINVVYFLSCFCQLVYVPKDLYYAESTYKSTRPEEHETTPLLHSTTFHPPSQNSFWAFMPDVFHPHTYVSYVDNFSA